LDHGWKVWTTKGQAVEAVFYWDTTWKREIKSKFISTRRVWEECYGRGGVSGEYKGKKKMYL